MNFLNTTYNINNIKKDSFIAYTHLGLGDHIVCNGLLNHFSEFFKEIYLPVKSRDFDNISYLYKNNPKIILFKIEHDTEVNDISSFAKSHNKKILKVGFKKRKPPFNKSFYDQFKLPYEISIEKFNFERNEIKEIELLNHLKNIYQVSDKFQLVHNQSSYGRVDLNVNNSLPIITIEKETDIFKNIFYYSKIIELASEIHCLDSSFLHLVERINTNAKLFFHNIKKEGQSGADVFLLKKWREIKYFI